MRSYLHFTLLHWAGKTCCIGTSGLLKNAVHCMECGDTWWQCVALILSASLQWNAVCSEMQPGGHWMRWHDEGWQYVILMHVNALHFNTLMQCSFQCIECGDTVKGGRGRHVAENWGATKGILDALYSIHSESEFTVYLDALYTLILDALHTWLFLALTCWATNGFLDALYTLYSWMHCISGYTVYLAVFLQYI